MTQLCGAESDLDLTIVLSPEDMKAVLAKAEEPLDSSESEWLADRLRVVRDNGVTIVLVDHDMSLVLGLCDHLHVLNFGSLIASGSPDHIRVDPAVDGTRNRLVEEHAEGETDPSLDPYGNAVCAVREPLLRESVAAIIT